MRRVVAICLLAACSDDPGPKPKVCMPFDIELPVTGSVAGVAYTGEDYLVTFVSPSPITVSVQPIHDDGSLGEQFFAGRELTSAEVGMAWSGDRLALLENSMTAKLELSLFDAQGNLRAREELRPALVREPKIGWTGDRFYGAWIEPAGAKMTDIVDGHAGAVRDVLPGETIDHIGSVSGVGVMAAVALDVGALPVLFLTDGTTSQRVSLSVGSSLDPLKVISKDGHLAATRASAPTSAVQVVELDGTVGPRNAIPWTPVGEAVAATAGGFRTVGILGRGPVEIATFDLDPMGKPIGQQQSVGMYTPGQSDVPYAMAAADRFAIGVAYGPGAFDTFRLIQICN